MKKKVIGVWKRIPAFFILSKIRNKKLICLYVGNKNFQDANGEKRH